MRLVTNSGSDRVIDIVRPHLARGNRLDAITPALSLFAFAEILRDARKLAGCRLVLPPADDGLELLGGPADRAARNRLQARWLARLTRSAGLAEVTRLIAYFDRVGELGDPTETNALYGAPSIPLEQWCQYLLKDLDADERR